jgi:hypothetical protein
MPDSARFVATTLSAPAAARRIRRNDAIDPAPLNPGAPDAASKRQAPHDHPGGNMNRYHAATPRPLLGLAAAALSVATLTIAVVMPSASQADAERAAVSAHVTEAVRIEPSRIVVIGSRETVMADERAAQRPST